MSDWKHLYGARWQKARAFHLTMHPLCVMCLEQGKRTRATVVDHVKPHKGDLVLFWDAANWQSLCAPHHNATKQREERRGHKIGVDATGRPLDAGHPWNRDGEPS